MVKTAVPLLRAYIVNSSEWVTAYGLLQSQYQVIHDPAENRRRK